MRAIDKRVKVLEKGLRELEGGDEAAKARSRLILARLCVRCENWKHPLDPAEEERQARELAEEWAEKERIRIREGRPVQKGLSPELRRKFEDVYGPIDWENEL